MIRRTRVLGMTVRGLATNNPRLIESIITSESETCLILTRSLTVSLIALAKPTQLRSQLINPEKLQDII